MFVCFNVLCVCVLQGWYQYIGMSWAMLFVLKDMIEEHQSCKSNAPLQMKQDTLHQYISIEQSTAIAIL